VGYNNAQLRQFRAGAVQISSRRFLALKPIRHLNWKRGKFQAENVSTRGTDGGIVNIEIKINP
jgi:hypothetical protein